MILIHCADLHLDANMESVLPTDKARERRQELLQTFTQLVCRAEKEKADAILLCGDVFDKKTISARAKKCVRDAVTGHPDIRFYFLQGNHDKNSFLSDWDKKPENLLTFGADWTSYSEKDNVVITGADIYGNAFNDRAESLFLDENKTNIVLLHGQVKESAAKKNDGGIDLRKLKQKNIDYLALGHIHSYRQEKLDKRGVWCYSGCLEGRGFDECGKKGYVRIVAKDGVVESAFVPFSHRTVHECEVDIAGCTAQEEICRKIFDEVCTIPEKDLVRVTLQGDLDPETESDTTQIEKWINREKEFYLFQVKDKTHVAIDPMDYRYDLSLKGEFVRRVLEAKMNQEDREKILRYGIRALAGGEIE